MPSVVLPRGASEKEWNNLDNTAMPVEGTTAEPKLSIQPFPSWTNGGDVYAGSGLAETITSTTESSLPHTAGLYATKSQDTHTEAVVKDDRYLQYGLIGCSFLILFCVAITIMYKTRNRPKILDSIEERTSTDIPGTDSFYETGESSARRNSKVNEAFHSTEISGQNAFGVSERAMTFNVLYRLEQQDPDYAVIDDCTEPIQTSQIQTNAEPDIYATVNKTTNGSAPNIKQSRDITLKQPTDIQADKQLPSQTEPSDVRQTIQE